MNSANIISVWGSGGSGKTTLAVNLGLAMAERNYLVGIVSSKLYYGEIQGLFGRRVEGEKGLYSAISNGCNTKNMFVSTTKNANLFILSVPNSFDAMLLSALSGDTARDLIYDAAMRFDYVIIDGSEELNNPLSSIGMSMASKVVTVHRVSAKDCAWQSSMDNTVHLLHIDEKQIHVINGYDKTCDKVTFISNIGLKFSFELPYIQNAKILENSGKLIYESQMGTREYKKIIQRLASQLLTGG